MTSSGVIQKPGGNVGLSSTTKSASLGSYVVGGTGAQAGTTSKNQQAAVARSRSAAAHSSSPTRPTTVSSPSSKVQSEEKEAELLPHDVGDVK
ncbi:hypothetical protein Pcinc_027776 [Petrolisthes cinctipes]|uniref:Uncharacterized protein n=1 Tax=Petrolisthes cinctipes TaxID=88211 RepID=A0AAE1F3B5_PETCI|nr:hypothetical protein Pcinc_027776 [Petrolisthes cinctipes]